MTSHSSFFAPATQAWLEGAFEAPTAAQEGAWKAISSGHNALVVAPTGFGEDACRFPVGHRSTVGRGRLLRPRNAFRFYTYRR